MRLIAFINMGCDGIEPYRSVLIFNKMSLRKRRITKTVHGVEWYEATDTLQRQYGYIELKERRS